jgi:hypothetical protein
LQRWSEDGQVVTRAIVILNRLVLVWYNGNMWKDIWRRYPMLWLIGGPTMAYAPKNIDSTNASLCMCKQKQWFDTLLSLLYSSVL